MFPKQNVRKCLVDSQPRIQNHVPKHEGHGLEHINMRPARVRSSTRRHAAQPLACRLFNCRLRSYVIVNLRHANTATVQSNEVRRVDNAMHRPRTALDTTESHHVRIPASGARVARRVT